jgi:hypothetical protein
MDTYAGIPYRHVTPATHAHIPDILAGDTRVNTPTLSCDQMFEGSTRATRREREREREKERERERERASCRPPCRIQHGTAKLNT